LTSSVRLSVILNVGALTTFGLLAPGFASPDNLFTLLVSCLPLLLLSVGQTFALVSGGIDLSMTAIVGLASVAGGIVMTGAGGGSAQPLQAGAIGVAAMLTVGALAGAVNGLSVGLLRVPAFMTTLTVGMFAGGLAVWLPRALGTGDTIAGLPSSFIRIGAAWPVAAGVAIAATLSGHVILSRCMFGHRLRAVGYNPRTARVSGVPIATVITGAYVLSGLLAAAAAILLTGRLETASPTHGRTLLLDVIGATVLGGTSLSGGRGTVGGTVLGALLLAIVGNGLIFFNLSDPVVAMVKGLIILAAALSQVSRAR
jgi:ribose/xylose/arabinose/galactoside ABC-type transport system permease subunit